MSTDPPPSPFLDGINLDTAYLAGLLCEGITYGIFLVLCACTVHAIYFANAHRAGQGSVVMMIAIGTMLVLATIQLILDTTFIFMGFLDKSRVERILFFHDPSVAISIARYAVGFAMIITGDVINIFRSYIVWDRRWLVVLPAVMCSLASTGCAIFSIWTDIRLDVDDSALLREDKLGPTFLSLSIAASVFSTALIAYRIWDTERSFIRTEWNKRRTNTLMPILMILVETGALNAAFLIVYIALLESGNVVSALIGCLATPFVGVVFTMMIVRIKLRRDRNKMTNMSSLHIRVPTILGTDTIDNPVQTHFTTTEANSTEEVRDIKESV